MTYNPTTADVSGHRAATAFFDSREAAEKAKADLIAAEIKPEAISIAGSDRPMSSAEIDAERNEPVLPEEGGFWHALKEFFMPDEDRYTYAEGLRRGGVVLSVQTHPEEYNRVLDILDADGAVDIDEREQSWKSEGWAAWQEGVDPLGGSLYRADNSTAGFGASMAGEDGFQPLPHEPPAGSAASSSGVTAAASPDAEARADVTRVGTGPGEAGVMNPDMRERIGSGTASMTPPTPTGPQDATLADNAALDRKAAIEDASLGSPTRSGAEMPYDTSTIGDVDKTEPSWETRRDSEVQRGRVRGYIVDPRRP